MNPTKNRRSVRWMGLVVGAAVVLSAGACRSAPETREEAGAEAAAKPKPPRTKATHASEPGALGTLPEGVGVEVGSGAPDASVTALDGQAVLLSDVFAKGPTMVVFYRGGWCPYCNYQIHQLAEAAPRLEEAGVHPIAISVDRIEEEAKTQAAWEIPFPVFSDSGLAAHKAYRVINQVDEKTVKRLGMLGLDLAEYSGQDHHVIAIPSIFIVDAGGVVRWAHAETDYSVRPSVDQLIEVIGGLEL